MRAADNEPDPSRGLAGYVTTYQGVAAAPELHLAEMRRHRTLLVVDEVHHLPGLADYEPGHADDRRTPTRRRAGAGRCLPLLECARVRLLLSGTLERADGRAVLWLPYRPGPRPGTRRVDMEAPGWAVVGYSRAQAVADRAVLPVTFGALDGEATWAEPLAAGADEDKRVTVGPHRLSGPHPTETTRPALFTALRTGFANALLRRAFEATRELRAKRRAERGLPAGAPARGLGKLLVVAPDQAAARAYLDALRGWMPAEQGRRDVRLATSSERDAHEALAAFRLLPEPSILVTVAMAYEGLDAPEVAVVAALTHIRSRPWLEQMIARATRVDPNAGPYDGQRALVFHPDDPLFATFRRRVETEQGTLAKRPKAARQGTLLPDWLLDQLAERGPREVGIVPLESNALGLRYATLKPGPSYAAARPENEAPQTELYDPPSVVERRLRLAHRRDGGGPGGRGRCGLVGAARAGALSRLQCRAQARDGRQEPGRDDDGRARGGRVMAGAQSPGGSPTHARRRHALRLERAPALVALRPHIGALIDHRRPGPGIGAREAPDGSAILARSLPIRWSCSCPTQRRPP